MLKVTVASTALDHLSGNSKVSGKPYSMFKQVVYFHTVDKEGVENMFPEKGAVLAEKDTQGNGIPYPAGSYFLHPSSFRLDKNGGLEVAARLVKMPVKSA